MLYAQGCIALNLANDRLIHVLKAKTNKVILDAHKKCMADGPKFPDIVSQVTYHLAHEEFDSKETGDTIRSTPSETWTGEVTVTAAKLLITEQLRLCDGSKDPIFESMMEELRDGLDRYQDELWAWEDMELGGWKEIEANVREKYADLQAACVGIGIPASLFEERKSNCHWEPDMQADVDIEAVEAVKRQGRNQWADKNYAEALTTFESLTTRSDVSIDSVATALSNVALAMTTLASSNEAYKNKSMITAMNCWHLFPAWHRGLYRVAKALMLHRFRRNEAERFFRRSAFLSPDTNRNTLDNVEQQLRQLRTTPLGDNYFALRSTHPNFYKYITLIEQKRLAEAAALSLPQFVLDKSTFSKTPTQLRNDQARVSLLRPHAQLIEDCPTWDPPSSLNSKTPVNFTNLHLKRTAPLPPHYARVSNETFLSYRPSERRKLFAPDIVGQYFIGFVASFPWYNSKLSSFQFVLVDERNGHPLLVNIVSRQPPPADPLQLLATMTPYTQVTLRNPFVGSRQADSPNYHTLYVSLPCITVSDVFDQPCYVCAKEKCTMTCGGCNSTYYCSKECQKGDWKHMGHKEACPSLKRYFNP